MIPKSLGGVCGEPINQRADEGGTLARHVNAEGKKVVREIQPTSQTPEASTQLPLKQVTLPSVFPWSFKGWLVTYKAQEQSRWQELPPSLRQRDPAFGVTVESDSW